MKENNIVEKLKDLTPEEIKELFSKMSLEDINKITTVFKELKKGLDDNG